MKYHAHQNKLMLTITEFLMFLQEQFGKNYKDKYVLECGRVFTPKMK